MLLQNWLSFLNRLVPGNKTRRPRRARHLSRSVESLEPRQLLATFTWTGATDNKLATDTNWAGGAAPTAAVDTDIVFPASFRTNLVNDLATGFLVRSITFGSSGYNITGTPSFKFGTNFGGIDNTTGSNTIASPLVLAEDFIQFSVASNSTLTLRGTIDADVIDKRRSLFSDIGASGTLVLRNFVGARIPLSIMQTSNSGATPGTLQFGTPLGGTPAIPAGTPYVTTFQNQSYGTDVALSTTTVLFSQGDVTTTGTQFFSDITFDGAVNSSAGFNSRLVVNTQADEVFNGPIGNTTPLSSLTTDASNNVGAKTTLDFNGVNGATRLNGGNTTTPTVQTTGSQTYNDTVLYGANTTLQTTGGSISFNGASGSLSTPVDLTLNAGSSITFGDGSGSDWVGNSNFTVGTFFGPSTNQLNTLTATATGNINFNVLNSTDANPSVNTIGNQVYNNPVRLLANTTLTGGGSPSFASTVTGTGTTQQTNLALNFLGDTTIDGALFNQIGALSSGGGGTTHLLGTITTGNGQFYNDVVMLKSDVTLNTQLSDINFGGSVDSDTTPRALVLSSPGNEIFNFPLGQTTPLASLTTDPDPVLRGGEVRFMAVSPSGSSTVRTIGAQTYNDRVALGADTSLLSTTVTSLIQAPVAGANVNVSRAAGDQTAPSIAIDPTNVNRMFAVGNVTTGTGLFAATSTDAGTTWTTRTLAGGNDNLVVAGTDATTSWDRFGNLFISYISKSLNQVVVARSADGGQSFVPVTTFSTTPLSTNLGQATVATGANSVWVTYFDGVQASIVAAGASVAGLGSVGTFTTPQLAPGSGQGNFGDIAIGPAGEVIVVYQSPANGSSPSSIFANIDADGLGAGGFSSAVLATSTNVSSQQSIPAQPQRGIDAAAGLAWDRSGGVHNGRVYLVYTDAPTTFNNDTNIFIRFSDDRGVNWSSPIQVNDDGTVTSQFLPRIAVDQTTGDVAVSWYDARNDPGFGSGDTDGIANTDVQVWAAVSVDGGSTFSANGRVSTGTSRASAVNNTGNYGGTTGLAFQSGAFYPIWTDNSATLGGNPDPSTSNATPTPPAVRFDIATARVTLASVSAPSNITFNSLVDSLTTTGRALQVNSPANQIFNGFVGSQRPLASLETDVNTTVGVGGQTQFNAANSTLTTPTVRTTGFQTYNDGALLSANTILTSTASGNLTFNRTIDGTFALTANSTGSQVFNGLVGATTPLSSILTDADGTIGSGGQSVFNIPGAIGFGMQSVKTTGVQAYNDAVALTQDTILSSTSFGNIAFNSTVDSATATPVRLTVNTGGSVNFGDGIGSPFDYVGAVNPLQSLTTNQFGFTTSSTTMNVGGSSYLNPSIRTVAEQRYQNQIVLRNDTVLVSGTSQFGLSQGFQGPYQLLFNPTPNADAGPLTGWYLVNGSPTQIFAPIADQLIFVNQIGQRSNGSVSGNQITAPGLGNGVGVFDNSTKQIRFANGVIWSKVDLTGTWSINGVSTQQLVVQQTGTRLAVTQFNTQVDLGALLSPNQLAITFPSGTLLGALSTVGTTQQIRFSDGQYWTKFSNLATTTSFTNIGNRVFP